MYKFELGKFININDIDNIRLNSQLKMRGCYFDCYSVEFKGVPIHNFKLKSTIELLPVINLNKELCKIKEITMVVHAFNQFNDIETITTEHAEFYIDKTLIMNPYHGNHYVLIRLRKGEGVTCKSILRWEKSTNARSQVILRPILKYNEKDIEVYIESRRFYTNDEIMNEIIKTILEDLKRYKSILCFVGTLEELLLHEKEYRYKKLNDHSYKIEIINDDKIDFDLGIKNVLSRTLNEETKMIFRFEYHEDIIDIYNTDIPLLNEIFETKIKYWENHLH